MLPLEETPPVEGALSPVQELVLERLDEAVAIGTVGLALVVFLLAVIAVRAMWS